MVFHTEETTRYISTCQLLQSVPMRVAWQRHARRIHTQHTTRGQWVQGSTTAQLAVLAVFSSLQSIQPLANCTSGTVVRGPTPSPPPAPPGNGSCSLARDCHYGGECVSGRCACDPTWTGPACERLNLLPARKGSGYPTSPATDTLPSNSTFTWGGAVVLDPEATQDR